MQPVYIFKMVDAPSEFVGTEKKIDLVGRFNCIVENKKTSSKTDEKKTEKETVCKLIVPTGYHFKAGFMASFTSPTKPDMKISAVTKYTGHCVCELESWN